MKAVKVAFGTPLTETMIALRRLASERPSTLKSQWFKRTATWSKESPGLLTALASAPGRLPAELLPVSDVTPTPWPDELTGLIDANADAFWSTVEDSFTGSVPEHVADAFADRRLGVSLVLREADDYVRRVVLPSWPGIAGMLERQRGALRPLADLPSGAFGDGAPSTLLPTTFASAVDTIQTSTGRVIHVVPCRDAKFVLDAAERLREQLASRIGLRRAALLYALDKPATGEELAVLTGTRKQDVRRHLQALQRLTLVEPTPTHGVDVFRRTAAAERLMSSPRRSRGTHLA